MRFHVPSQMWIVSHQWWLLKLYTPPASLAVFCCCFLLKHLATYCVHVHAGGRVTGMPRCVCYSQRQLVGVSVLLPPCGFGYGTQVTRLDGKCIVALSLPPAPVLCILTNLKIIFIFSFKTGTYIFICLYLFFCAKTKKKYNVHFYCLCSCHWSIFICLVFIT